VEDGLIEDAAIISPLLASIGDIDVASDSRSGIIFKEKPDSICSRSVPASEPNARYVEPTEP
jgi:hypothetical protein